MHYQYFPVQALFYFPSTTVLGKPIILSHLRYKPLPSWFPSPVMPSPNPLVFYPPDLFPPGVLFIPLVFAIFYSFLRLSLIMNS